MQETAHIKGIKIVRKTFDSKTTFKLPFLQLCLCSPIRFDMQLRKCNYSQEKWLLSLSELQATSWNASCWHFGHLEKISLPSEIQFVGKESKSTSMSLTKALCIEAPVSFSTLSVLSRLCFLCCFTATTGLACEGRSKERANNEHPNSKSSTKVQ